MSHLSNPARPEDEDENKQNDEKARASAARYGEPAATLEGLASQQRAVWSGHGAQRQRMTAPLDASEYLDAVRAGCERVAGEAESAPRRAASCSGTSKLASAPASLGTRAATGTRDHSKAACSPDVRAAASNRKWQRTSCRRAFALPRGSPSASDHSAYSQIEFAIANGGTSFSLQRWAGCAPPGGAIGPRAGRVREFNPSCTSRSPPNMASLAYAPSCLPSVAVYAHSRRGPKRCSAGRRCSRQRLHRHNRAAHIVSSPGQKAHSAAIAPR